MLHIFPSVEHRICPGEHVEVLPAEEVVPLIIEVAIVVPRPVVVTTIFELSPQIIAPLRHLVPEDTAPILTYPPLTQTDQLRPSDEQRIAPVRQIEKLVAGAECEVLVEEVELEEVELEEVGLVVLFMVLDDVELVLILVELKVELNELEELELEGTPLAKTVTSLLFPGVVAQSEVGGTLLSPA